MKTLFSHVGARNEHCILIDESVPLAVIELKGEFEHQEYKEILLSFLQVCKDHQTHRFVFDLRAMERSSGLSRAWLISSFAPMALRTFGKAYAAVLKSKVNLFQRISVDTARMAVETLGANMNVQIFDDLEQALQWLASTAQENAPQANKKQENKE
jgi:anti-anti-sigma regulatory factor